MHHIQSHYSRINAKFIIADYCFKCICSHARFHQYQTVRDFKGHFFYRILLCSYMNLVVVVVFIAHYNTSNDYDSSVLRSLIVVM